MSISFERGRSGSAPLPLRATGLAHRYGPPAGGAAGAPALADFELDLAPGQVVALIGPNGSGKTTALRCLLGLLEPTAGRVESFGKPPGARAQGVVGYAPERFEPTGSRTGLETLEAFAALSRVPRPRDDARDLLARFGLGAAADKRVRAYSKGMRRRLAIAQSLLPGPDLWILDEPFDGLDPLGVAKVREEIAARRDQGVAIVVSSHQLADAEAVATHLVLLHRGATLARGDVASLLERRGRTRLEIEWSDAAGAEPGAALREAIAAIAALGGTVVEEGAPRESLEALFSRLVPREPS
jgi:ABC-type multidrug transport system ATPase subunit